ncbi:hypothetical protein [Streptomyces sp. NPDC097610]|uniref:hypothetical protein n=1 Tax=Streptomyces sp. NPDC097610 TaxID=3157227 RepID=UPI003321B826
MSQNLCSRSIRWMAAGLLAASVVGGVTGCSSDSDSSADAKPVAEGTAASPKKEASKESEAQSSGARQASAQEAVATFVSAVVEDRWTDACLVMAQSEDGATPAQLGSPKLCNSNDPATREMQKNVSSMGKSFRPNNLTGASKVEVVEVPPTSNKVQVPADKIMVNGKPLDDVILSNSTGVSKEQLDVKVESVKIEGKWWVNNVEFNIG